MLSLIALSVTAPVVHPMPAKFDLASYNAFRQPAQQAMQRRYLPADPELPESDAPDISLRWRLTKVKLKMALDLPY